MESYGRAFNLDAIYGHKLGDGELDGIYKIWQHARDELANGCCAFEEVATSLVVGRVTGAL